MSDDRPKAFGDYTLLTKLAQGGMGSIHLAKRVGFRADIQRFLVVKKLLRASSHDLRRFEDEARVVVTLNHRALCQVFDVGIVDDEHYLAMELVEGVTLQRAAAAVRFSTAVALYVIDEMLDALDYAHHHRDPATGQALHIVHRDVSPQNVMLSFSGAVKLIDFGLVSSTLKQERTVGGVVVGKLEYMAPEQARAEPLDARSDVYAAAVVAYELLSGRRFYEGLAPGEVMSAVVDGTHVPPFDGIEPALVGPLSRALAGEREERTPSCAALQAELAAAAVPRGSSRDLRDALQRALPEEQARLEALMRGFRDVDVEPPDVETKIRHIARSDEEARARAARETAAAVTSTHVSRDADARDISAEPTRIGRPRRTASAAQRRPRLPPLVLGGLALFALVVVVVVVASLALRGANGEGAARVGGAADDDAAMPAGDLAGGDARGDARARTGAAPNHAVAARAGDAGEAVETPGGAVPIDEAAAVAPGADSGAAHAAPAEVDAAPRPGAAPARATDAGAAAVDDGTADEGADEGADAGAGGDARTTGARAVHKRSKRVRPPSTPLPDLAAQLDYLGRWCSRTTCARRVLAARGRIPLLDVAGLQALRREAEACVVECRR